MGESALFVFGEFFRTALFPDTILVRCDKNGSSLTFIKDFWLENIRKGYYEAQEVEKSMIRVEVYSFLSRKAQVKT